MLYNITFELKPYAHSFKFDTKLLCEMFVNYGSRIKLSVFSMFPQTKNVPFHYATVRIYPNSP